MPSITIRKTCILLIILAFCVLPSTYGKDEAPVSTITVEEMEGHAFLSVPGRAPRPIMVGDRVSVQERIRTGPGSSITLRLSGITGGVARVGEDSVFAVRSQETGADIQLTQGDISVNLGKLLPGSTFTVTLPAT